MERRVGPLLPTGLIWRKLSHIEGEVATIKAKQERKNVQHAQLMGQLTEIKSAFVKEEIK
jgi:hypothetical protein